MPQDESAASYGCTRISDDGEIDWSASTKRVYALVRALGAPYPGAFTYLGMRRMRIVRAVPVADPPRYIGRVPGRVVGRSSRKGYAESSRVTAYSESTKSGSTIPPVHSASDASPRPSRRWDCEPRTYSRDSKRSKRSSIPESSLRLVRNDRFFLIPDERVVTLLVMA